MISVLTVNYHSSPDLALLAESIRGHQPAEPVELVVTNNSPADSIRLASDERLSVSVEPARNRGFAAGINAALRRSQGDILMVANPDVRVQAGTLNAAADFLRRTPDVGLVLPLLRHPEGAIQSSIRRFYTWPVVLYARTPLRWAGFRPGFFRRYLCEDMDRAVAQPVDWGLGAAMFLRRCDVAPEGVFDERFFIYFEDVDLCLRTWRRGLKVFYCPQVECVHAHRRSSRNPFSLAGRRHVQSLIRFIRKHGGLPQRPVHSAQQA